MPRAHGKGRRQRLFFFFFLKKFLCRESLTKAVGKDGFLFFKKTFFAERLVQLRSAKLGTPELGKFFPELPRVIARSSRQRGLCRRPLSAKSPLYVLFFSFHIDKYIYIYTHTSSYITTSISNPSKQVHNMIK
jgi:hypothetical protein